ncbi:GNAT family N-acetyltransferase [Fictibacillus nanhaiensis]|uniref:GNAT family N-acetyltransferase n=1 Tax=Fictibacillus nanhaiensis TaxID=742169 RepID=UPI002E1F3F0D|nr:GNAT family N-acetyltransferase [Fictibacillus nanhaiensis]
MNESRFVIELEGKQDVFSFRPVEFERDVDTLFNWMHQSHIAPFWKLNLPIKEFTQWLNHSIESKQKDIYIGSYNDIPICYLIAYAVKDDPIKKYYSYHKDDLGMHLLIGPRSYLNKEDGLSIIRGMILFLFEHYGAQRIIGEPDVRNRIIIPILKGMGGEVKGTIQLPHKKATLIMGERELIMNKLDKDGIQVTFINKLSQEGITL